jgi:hypothetical protein
MHNEPSIDRPDLGDTPINKRSQSGRDIMKSVEFVSLREDVNDAKINKALNKGEDCF